MPRMAAGESAQRQPRSSQGAMHGERFMRVMRATRIEAAAGPEPGADDQLVTADQCLQDQAHDLASLTHNAARLLRNASLLAVRAALRAPTTISACGRLCCASRNDSRITRRTRLRATALPTVRAAIASPRRGAPVVFIVNVKVKMESESRLPRLYVASKSLLRRTRRCAGNVRRVRGFDAPPTFDFSGTSCDESIRESASCGPSLGDEPGPCGHSASPCGRESHGYARGGPCWVDMCASCDVSGLS